ncbi:hypothetical protein ONE63_009698 [Megalurothrips usitatus]|uniref:Uncharacterized protein n=1 Tax=Megalurothrips usitatus TaxID=439358 RepID=A0AAV7XMC8_9NEOP|nr:hypothetical protein ONE63_009698 [Megalurothrips usitatus]
MPWLPLRLRWSSPASGGPSGCGPPLLTVFLALAAVVGHSSGSSAAGPAGPAGGVVPGGGPTAAAAAAATTAPRAAVKDLGFGPSGYGRGGFESVLAAVFNKVAKGTTATPMTTRPPPAAPTTTAVPTTTRPPATTARPATVPPPPTETVPLRPPPPPPPMEGLGVVGGVPPTRRAPHPLPDYAPPNRPPPLPAEYNPFANKAILRGSQSEIGSATPGRKSHPQHLPRPSMDELIPLRPVNTPSQGSSGKDAAPALPEPPRPERPPERAGAAGKHHLDSHIHTVASAPAAVPALTPIGHHQGGHGGGHHGHHGNGHGTDHSLKAAKPTELLEQVNKDSIIQQGLEIQSEVAIVADPAIHRDEDNRDKVRSLGRLGIATRPSAGTAPEAAAVA